MRVDVAVDQAWVVDGHVEVVASSPANSRIRLDPGTDAGAVLDVVRNHRPVTDFGVEAPTLSELFIAAVGRSGTVSA